MPQDWMPGVIKDPVDWATDLSRYGDEPNTLVVHITAGNGSAKSTGAFFRRGKTACSTFAVDRDGTPRQFQPISARSGADAGSRVTVSIENVGTNGPLTAAQIVTNARIFRFLNEDWGIPFRLISTSARTQKGLGSHRFGVDGNFPLTGIQRGRLQRWPRGEKWSSARGKTCPTNAAQAQLPDILRLASVSGGGGASVPAPTPARPSKPKEKATPNRLPSLRRGDRGGWVGLWQNFLKTQGYSLATDESFGGNTEAATRKWQRKVNAQVDGVVGPESWVTALGKDGDGALRQGDRNPSVEILQNIIGTKDKDASFGPKTQETLKQVQRYLKVADDGVCGPKTRKRLYSWWT